ncbi:type II toxin-antitoxin system death-on-curing family toxin [Mastigocoleus testarum]|uniref:Death-on-curing protein n=1 Tax=Mastigocoleus testarum BC008 TaxID=371196 RepID=A0A0V7ZVP0_9CYAN|nr:type II toxin-antitoxin system death-on-curing family toxin [Mastigocoleus testarum]KST68633.1 death-on-curing protein [Mastigocoleus testarum BC008]
MAEPIWITTVMVQMIHDDQVATHGGAYGLRDEGLLESALARGRHRYGYEEGVDIYRLAADYGYGIARNHPFIDGNKRTAFQVMYAFLKVNGCVLNAPEPEVVLVMRSLASGELSEDELAQWLKQYSSKEE